MLRVGLALALVSVLGGSPPVMAAPGRGPGDDPKLDRELNRRDREVKGGTSRAIIQLNPGWDASAEVVKLGGKLGKRLGLMNGLAVELPNKVLRNLANHPGVARVIWDRPLDPKMNLVSVAVGARAVQHELGLTGAGVGIAVIDSGISSWHDDLTYGGPSPAVKTSGGQRVAGFVDFVGGRTAPYDDYGHGTHVSGIIAGNGYDSSGYRAGIAPDAHLVGLKVLDANGRGVISNVIAAIEWAVTNRAAYNIRVINLSVGAGVAESYNTDPLTLAARRAVDAGIVVVAAAGNLGQNKLGQAQYGGITAPGNAPWVLTVGASSTEGTVSRKDDVYAPYSSRGPSAVDYMAKPDLLAPGTGVVSLSDPASQMYLSRASFLVNGTRPLASKPYLSLSGTSMAAPVIAGTVALMLQANPSLTPNLVKAMLQYTAQPYPGYDVLTQGAGFLNTKGAVDMARYFGTAQAGQRYPMDKRWSRSVIWGTHRLRGGVLRPDANAWKLGTVWGAPKDPVGNNIVWGTLAPVADYNIVWGTALDPALNIVWGTALDPALNIVWGTAPDPALNIVWGTACGGADCSGVIWGTVSAMNIAWGTSLDPILNIVWGTALEPTLNIVWGTSGGVDTTMWATSGEDTTLFVPAASDPLLDVAVPFDNLFADPIPVVAPMDITPVSPAPIGGLL